jgi:hypothetical protein
MRRAAQECVRANRQSDNNVSRETFLSAWQKKAGHKPAADLAAIASWVKYWTPDFRHCQMKSQLAIHLLAASLAGGSMLSRMRSTGCAGASKARVLDNIESTSPIMPAVE